MASPTDYDLLNWWNGDSITTSLGGNVSSWDDDGGSNDLEVDESYNRGTAQILGPNGKKGVLFDGGNDWMFNASLSVNDPCTVMIAFAKTQSYGDRFYFGSHNSTSQYIRIRGNGGYVRSHCNGIFSTSTAVPVANTDVHIYSIVAKATSGRFRVDGVEQDNNLNYPMGFDGIRLGGFQGGYGWGDMHVGEFMIFNGDIGDVAIAVMENYLKFRWQEVPTAAAAAAARARCNLIMGVSV